MTINSLRIFMGVYACKKTYCKFDKKSIRERYIRERRISTLSNDRPLII